MSRLASATAAFGRRNRWIGVAPGSASPARIGSLAFVRAYAVTMRPYLLFVSGITGLAGLAAAPAVPLGKALALAAAFLLSYGFGQALTDCFQTDTDSLSSPYRPLVRGEVSRRDVAIVSLLGLVTCGTVFCWSRPLVNGILCGLAVAGLLTYTWFKRRWWGGPLYNALIVTLLFAIGYVAGGGTWPAGGGTTAGLAAADGSGGAHTLRLFGAAIAVLFGYADFVLTGYFKDVPADAATGYRTFPVAFGMRQAAHLAHGFALLALAGVVLALAAGGIGRASPAAVAAILLLVTAGSAALLLAHVRLEGTRDPKAAHQAIAPVVHAYILLLASLAAASRPEWLPALLLLYAGFVVTLALRPMKEQI